MLRLTVTFPVLVTFSEKLMVIGITVLAGYEPALVVVEAEDMVGAVVSKVIPVFETCVAVLPAESVALKANV